MTALLVAAGSLAPPLAVAEQPLEPTLSAQDEFRALSAAGRYTDALPYAQQVVALADASAGADLPAALNDLARTQFQLGDLAGAEASYMRSLELLENSQGISSPRFVAPLAGIAAVYAAQNRHAQAIAFYRQALAVSRRALGLFNPAQTELLEALTSSYMALDNFAEAQTARRYIVQIGVRNYGAEDPRILPALWQLGRWYESTYNYVSSRLVYAHIYHIARKESGDNNPEVIDALLAIGRAYRLQFADDPESVASRYASVDQMTQTTRSGIPWSRQRDFAGTLRLDRDGQKALERALGILEQQTDPPAELMIRTLLELGDWFMAGRQPDVALQHYTRVATILAGRPGDGEAGLFVAPRLVVLHPPPGSVTHRLTPRAQVIVRQASFTLTVTDRGETRDVVLTHSDMSSMQAFQLQQALQKALYSPRFEDGRPVATAGVAFTSQWFELIPPKPEPAPADSG